jgi:hypothetical protein
VRIGAGLALTLLLAGGPLMGQTPSLVSDVDTTLISVGDRITYHISVDHLPESRVVWPDSLNLEPFEVLAGRADQPSSRGETSRSSMTLSLTAFELGNLEIPSFPVEVINEEGESTVLHTNPFGIQVSSVGLDEGEDIRQLKEPLGIPVSLVRMLLLALVGFLALAGGILLFRRMRRREPKLSTPIPDLPARPPHEVALEAFQRLEASPLLEQGKVKDFHIQASEILRVYVEGQYRVAALEMTTSDISGGLAKTGMEPSVLEEFRRFLHECDMVKFAKSRPSDADSKSLLGFGRKLVEATV